VTRSRSCVFAALAAFLLGSGPASRAAEFIRGDVNGDGVVTIADGVRILMWFRDGLEPPPCLDAADVNDNGIVGSGDVAYLLQTLYSSAGPIPPPFPAPGEDPTDDLELGVDCESYGGGARLEDAAFRLQVLDGTARGGAESAAQVELLLSNPVEIAAVSATIRLSAPILRGAGMTTPIGWSYTETLSGEDYVSFGALGESENSAPPGEDARVRLIATLCFEAGTPAGEYAVSLEAAELTDATTGQAIVPHLEGGTLVVEAAVTGGPDESVWSVCRGPPRDPPPSPETVNAAYKLASRSVVRGGTVTIPFTVRADEPIEGYSFSMDFDEELLEVESAPFVWRTPGGAAYAFASVEVNNRNDASGNAGVDEGYIAGAAVFSFTAPVTMPPDTDNLALELDMRARPDAQFGTTKIRFLNGGRNASGVPASNLLTAHGFSVTPGITSSFVFVDARISIVPDVTVFIRGDANGDGVLDISDPTLTLGYLFLGGRRPSCYDAADANDDGRLDNSDPVATLYALFIDERQLPAPSGTDGEDPTLDGMTCSTR